MIDYDKLKLAHSLCDEFAKTKKQTCRITHIYHGGDSVQFYRINTYDNCGKEADVHLSLDDLIAKLKSLVKPEPNYPSISEKCENYQKLKQEFTDKISDLQWRMNAVCNELSLRNKPVTQSSCDNVVTECQHKWSMTGSGICIKCGIDFFAECHPNNLCAPGSSLLKCDTCGKGYWYRKESPCLSAGDYLVTNDKITKIDDKCQHESDGSLTQPPNYTQYLRKCNKCGEFYR